jgi:hypothetical protein
LLDVDKLLRARMAVKILNAATNITHERDWKARVVGI